MQRVRAAPTPAVGTLFFLGGLKGKCQNEGKQRARRGKNGTNREWGRW